MRMKRWEKRVRVRKQSTTSQKNVTCFDSSRPASLRCSDSFSAFRMSQVDVALSSSCFEAASFSRIALTTNTTKKKKKNKKKKNKKNKKNKNKNNHNNNNISNSNDNSAAS